MLHALLICLDMITVIIFEEGYKFKAPQNAIISHLILLLPSYAKIFHLAPGSQKPSIYAAKFHIHTQKTGKIIVYFNFSAFRWKMEISNILN
jgi:hypothetical protein